MTDGSPFFDAINKLQSTASVSFYSRGKWVPAKFSLLERVFTVKHEKLVARIYVEKMNTYGMPMIIMVGVVTERMSNSAVSNLVNMGEFRTKDGIRQIWIKKAYLDKVRVYIPRQIEEVNLEIIPDPSPDPNENNNMFLDDDLPF